jgi:hypothetical protein
MGSLMSDARKKRSPAGAGRVAAAFSGRVAVNAHVRLSGVVRIGPRYAMLEADCGNPWRLRSEDDLRPLKDRRAVLEGRVVSADEIAILWIGAEEAGEAEAPE